MELNRGISEEEEVSVINENILLRRKKDAQWNGNEAQEI